MTEVKREMFRDINLGRSYCLLILIFSSNILALKTKSIQNIFLIEFHNVFFISSFIFLFSFFVINFIMIYGVNTNKIELRNDLSILMEKAMFFTFGLSFIACIISHGDFFIKEFELNPMRFMAFLLSFVLIVILAMYINNYFKQEIIANKTNRSKVASLGIARARLPLPVLTNHDKARVAAHEASHALCYAALGSLPKGVEAIVLNKNTVNGTVGSISSIHSRNTINSSTYNEWLMLVYLSGGVGEEVLRGEKDVGCSQDNVNWFNAALWWLKNENKEIFYPNPENEYEFESNKEMLARLRQKQTSILIDFYRVNSGVHRELTDFLLKKEKLVSEDFVPFLKRVVYPDGFPFPQGRFEEFSDICGIDETIYVKEES